MENKTMENKTIDMNDIVAVVRLIDVVSTRGAFQGSELADVGALRNKLEALIKANTPKPEAPANPEITSDKSE